MANDEELDVALILQIAAAQVLAFNKRQRSQAGIDYGDIMEWSAASLREFTKTANFEQLLMSEKIFQQNDLNTFAKVPATLQAVQKGIRDFEAGEGVYRQLLQSPDAYKAHSYREDDRAPPDRLIPLDAMRKALRGQVSRVGNYRKTVLGSSQEYDFMTARIAMIRRAEKLYDTIQRSILVK